MRPTGSEPMEPLVEHLWSYNIFSTNTVHSLKTVPPFTLNQAAFGYHGNTATFASELIIESSTFKVSDSKFFFFFIAELVELTRGKQQTWREEFSRKNFYKLN